MNKNLYVLSGSSGVGKGTVLKGFLAKHPEFILSISNTTRNPRKGEVNGINYFFVTKDNFTNAVKNDQFIEWAEFSGNYYGTRKDFVKNSLENGKNVILEIDTQGALQIKKKIPDSILIFIAPPSFEELEKRLRGRNTESEEAIEKRLKFVKLEMENSKKFDYVVVNDTVENAINQLEKVMEC